MRFRWREGVEHDYRQLPTDLRPAFVGLVERLLIEPYLGEHLHGDERVGDLSDCRKIKFGGDTERGPSHRLIYRLLPDAHAPAQVEVICVRPRPDVYETAAERLVAEPPS